MKKYKVIYADPPWAYKVWSKKGAGRSAESHYPTMDIAAIKALPVGSWRTRTAPCFSGSPSPCCGRPGGVMDAWGFTFKTVAFVWIKQCRKSEGLFTGMGYWTRANAEICLLATRRTPEAGGAGCEAGHPLPRGAAQPEAGGGAAADRSPHGGRAPY